MSARPTRQKERQEHSMAIGLLYLFLIMCVIMDERVFVYACVEWGTGAIGPFAVNSNLIR